MWGGEINVGGWGVRAEIKIGVGFQKKLKYGGRGGPPLGGSENFSPAPPYTFKWNSPNGKQAGVKKLELPIRHSSDFDHLKPQSV